MIKVQVEKKADRVLFFLMKRIVLKDKLSSIEKR